MIGRLVNDRLEKVCDEAIITEPRSLLGINREELRKTTEILSQSPVKSGTRHHADTNQKLHCWRVLGGGLIFLWLAFVNLLSDERNIVTFLFSFLHTSNWRN